MANTTSPAETPRSEICFSSERGEILKALDRFDERINHRPPSTLIVRCLQIRGGDALVASPSPRRRALPPRFRQKSRQMESSRMLNRPVEPQPVKNIFPPLRKAASTVAAIGSGTAGRSKLAEFLHHVAVLPGTAGQARRRCRLRHVAQVAVTGCEDSGDERAELELAADLQNSSERFCDVMLILKNYKWS